MVNNKAIPAFLLIAGFLVNSCSTSDSVKDYISDQMNPFTRKHVNFAIYSRVIDGQLNAFCSIQLMRNELTFTQTQNGYTGSYQIRLLVKRDLAQIVLDTTITRSVLTDSFDETRQLVLEKLHIGLPAERGSFTIDGLVTDVVANSDHKFKAVYRLDTTDESILVSSVRFVESTDPKDISVTKQLPLGPTRQPMISFDVSIPTAFQSPLELQVIISRLKADTSIARPIYGINPIQGTIETRGYRTDESLYTVSVFDTAIAPDIKGTFTINHPVPDTLRQGAYTASVRVYTVNKQFQTPGELFFIFPEAFPYIRNLGEAIKIVRYLTTTGEYERMTTGPDSLRKKRFDDFWLKLTEGNQQVARRKIGEFYQRAEDANRFFSTYKPGWRTDLGMAYIVLGTPAQVEWTPTQLTWYYYSRRYGANIPLVFNPIRVGDQIVGYSFLRTFDYEEFFMDSRRNWER